jgi:hypothetical protein
MARKVLMGMAGAGLLALAAGMVPASACPYGTSAQTTTDQQTSASSDQLPVPTDSKTKGDKTTGG